MVKGSRCNDRCRAVVDVQRRDYQQLPRDRHSAGEAARKILYYSVSLLYPATVFVWYK